MLNVHYDIKFTNGTRAPNISNECTYPTIYRLSSRLLNISTFENQTIPKKRNRVSILSLTSTATISNARNHNLRALPEDSGAFSRNVSTSASLSMHERILHLFRNIIHQFHLNKRRTHNVHFKTRSTSPKSR